MYKDGEKIKNVTIIVKIIFTYFILKEGCLWNPKHSPAETPDSTSTV
jgi:hypothetical protein